MMSKSLEFVREGSAEHAGMSAHAIVKARTAAAHARVDAAFGRFDLGRRESYVRFLQAHGRVVPAVEAALGQGGLPQWRPRTGCLQSDLAACAHTLPLPIADVLPQDDAERFGLLYVLEGSRLGGRLLLRRVGPGFPARYLAAIHRPGEWRAFTRALDARAAAGDGAWVESMVAGALHGFALYGAAAEEA
jgi:heme oxygenase (biliverdin-IX-beta and delta-forming)